jgi:hypothetical protein
VAPCYTSLWPLWEGQLPQDPSGSGEEGPLGQLSRSEPWGQRSGFLSSSSQDWGGPYHQMGVCSGDPAGGSQGGWQSPEPGAPEEGASRGQNLKSRGFECSGHLQIPFCADKQTDRLELVLFSPLRLLFNAMCFSFSLETDIGALSKLFFCHMHLPHISWNICLSSWVVAPCAHSDLWYFAACSVPTSADICILSAGRGIHSHLFNLGLVFLLSACTKLVPIFAPPACKFLHWHIIPLSTLLAFIDPTWVLFSYVILFFFFRASKIWLHFIRLRSCARSQNTPWCLHECNHASSLYMITFNTCTKKCI